LPHTKCAGADALRKLGRNDEAEADEKKAKELKQ
jgi:hypothetical protein